MSLMQENKNFSLKIGQIKEALQADIFLGEDQLETKIAGVYASDLMSDVLACGKPESVLLTGLCTNQAAISAYMADFKAVIFLRGKKPPPDILKFAKEKRLIVLSTKNDMFEACVKVAGTMYPDLLPSDGALDSSEVVDEEVTTHNFHIDGRDFANSGLLSSRIKSILKDIGYDGQLIRRIAISTYEGEMNVVMHAISAEVTLTAGKDKIVVVIDDKGKGIPDVKKAMQEGFSTATDDQRAMGFGAGMGLPNIKKNSDDLNVTSEVGEGTKIEMKFFVK